MTSIYGARHKQAVADARGKPPGWGTPGHANYNPPGRPGAYQPLDNSPLAASLLHQRSMAPSAPKIPPTDPPIPDPYGQRHQSLLYGNNMTPTPPQMNGQAQNSPVSSLGELLGAAPPPGYDPDLARKARQQGSVYIGNYRRGDSSNRQGRQPGFQPDGSWWTPNDGNMYVQGGTIPGFDSYEWGGSMNAPKIPPTDPPEDPYGQRPPGYGGGIMPQLAQAYSMRFHNQPWGKNF